MNICFNGNFLPADAPVITAQNRGFKWGDGVFETMKVFRGNLLLADYHFERLFMSLKLLQINPAKTFTKENLSKEVSALCHQNNCKASARIRLAVYRTHEQTTGYLIEAFALAEEVNQWDSNGLIVTLYPYVRKSMDAFANLKTANFLPYVLAANYAQEKGTDDALVLNAGNYICDSSRANIFLIKAGEVLTPALHQGCINGVMRRVVIEEIKNLGYTLRQQEVTQEELATADEVFLTNAIQMIRPVKEYNEFQYVFKETKKIYEAVAATIFNGLC
ncbi:MAG: aminotransferase class IV [Bacteroidota bacterium]|nr:aminotransferase class IV [Bacteroidota bacterium]